MERMIDADITPERLGFNAREWEAFQGLAKSNPERALATLEQKLNVYQARAGQIVESEGGVTRSAREQALGEDLSMRQTSPGTEAARIGTQQHGITAAERRLSGEWDLVDQRMIGPDGRPVQVPDSFDAAGNPAPGAGLRTPEPDAVSYTRGMILEDKPLGRNPLADRNQILGYIRAYEQVTGASPRVIAITYYNPDTGLGVSTVLFDPNFFR